MFRASMFTLALASLGLSVFAPSTAHAASCSINCWSGSTYLGSCSISANKAVTCKCTPYPVCKRIWALETTTLGDFTATSQEQLDEIDVQLELAVDLGHNALAEALERLREAVVGGDRGGFAVALAEYDRLVAELPAEKASR